MPFIILPHESTLVGESVWPAFAAFVFLLVGLTVHSWPEINVSAKQCGRPCLKQRQVFATNSVAKSGFLAYFIVTEVVMHKWT